MSGRNSFLSVCGVVLFIVVAIAPNSGKTHENRFVTLGTAGVNGLYYPVGGSLCQSFNVSVASYLSVRCVVETTEGSAYNLNMIDKGKMGFGIVQSDMVFDAVHQLRTFSNQEPMEHLRTVLSLYSEPFMIVARRSAGIETFDNIRGKRINIGNPGSGHRQTMTLLMDETGLTLDDFAFVSELSSDKQTKALCSNRIDAFVYVAGNPNSSLHTAMEHCDAVLVAFPKSLIDRLTQKYPFFEPAVIDDNTYPGHPERIDTFAVRAQIIASQNMQDEIVYDFVKAVLTDFRKFKDSNEVLQPLATEDMVNRKVFAPFHPGALRYFREAELIE